MKDLTNFFYEVGQLKRVKRSGWWLAGIDDPESVAEHSFRTAVIGYVLAKMEGADAEKVMTICLFHDLPEARVNDLHKLGQSYVDHKTAEKKAFSEQMQRVDEKTRISLTEIFEKNNNDNSQESIIARDADLLECAFQAKEYMERGYDTESWIDKTEGIVSTKIAKQLIKQLRKSKSTEWWDGLKKVRR